MPAPELSSPVIAPGTPALPTQTTPPGGARPDNVRGMVWMALAALAMVTSNMLVKEATATLPPIQVVFFRAIVIVTCLAPWVLRHPGLLMLGTTWRLHIARALLGTSAFVLTAYALKYMVFADAVALAHTIPLWVIVVSLLLYGEHVGWRRTTATLAGFAGVLMIVRPSVDMNPFALAALGGALLSAFEMFVVKRMTRSVTVAGIVFTYSVLGILFTAIPAAMTWVTPDPREWMLAAGVGIAAMIGHLTMVNAYRLGEATAITPVGYMRMPFSVLIGLFIFDELPHLWSIVGTVVILSATLYISFREARLKREGRIGGGR